MKIKQRMQNRREINLKISQGTNNALKCSKTRAETLSHKITKFWLANFCWERGLDFATEVVFKDNQRADIVIKDWMMGIEVLGSEGIKDYMKKTYPIPTIPVPSTMSVEELWEMLVDLEATEGGGWDYYQKKHIQNMAEMKKARKVIKSMEEMRS